MIHPADVPLGFYLNHKSLAHRLPTAPKPIVIITFLLFTGILVDTWPGGAITLAIVTIAYAMAKVPPMVAFQQLRGVVIILVLLSLLLW